MGCSGRNGWREEHTAEATVVLGTAEVVSCYQKLKVSGVLFSGVNQREPQQQ